MILILWYAHSQIDGTQLALLRGLAAAERAQPVVANASRYIAATPGRIVLLVGKPGSGKSSAARALAGLSGRALIRLAGADLARGQATADVTLANVLLIAKPFTPQILVEDVELALEAHGHPHHLPGQPSLPSVAKVAAFLDELVGAAGIHYVTTRRPDAIDPSAFDFFSVVVRLGAGGGRAGGPAARRRLWADAFGRAGYDLADGGGAGQRRLTDGAKSGDASPRPTVDARELDRVTAGVGDGLAPRDVAHAVEAARALALDAGEPLAAGHVRAALDAARRGAEDLRLAIAAEGGERLLYL